MFAPTPELVDPWRAVEAGCDYSGSLPLARMARLQEALREALGEASFRLSFSRDLEGRGILRGEIDARLVLTCQRCLEAMEVPVSLSMVLALVSGLEEAGRLPEDLDPLLVTSEPLRLADLIEDELLLALPLIPRHEPGACPASHVLAAKGEERREEGPPRPFAILGELRRRGD